MTGLFPIAMGLVLLSASGAALAQGEMISVSIPALRIAPHERVVELYIKAGRIARLPDVPLDWSLSIGNDPSWNTDVEGTVMVRAAALDAAFFRTP